MIDKSEHLKKVHNEYLLNSSMDDFVNNFQNVRPQTAAIDYHWYQDVCFITLLAFCKSQSLFQRNRSNILEDH